MAGKDMTEKALEAYDDVFADIVNNLIYEGIPVITENELEQGRERSVYSSEKGIRQQERDTSKYWKNKTFRIAFFGLENETEPEDDMPFRVIGYDGASYRDQIRYEKDKDGKRYKVLDRYPVVTLVLYFGYEKHWDKAKSIYEVISAGSEKVLDDVLRPFVNDYRINLFEIAFLTDEKVRAFTSDFRFVADYFVQMRRTGTYKGTDGEMIHVREVMQLLTELTGDHRLIDIVDRAEKEGKDIKNMGKLKWIDELEKIGFEKGIEKGIERGQLMEFISLRKDDGYSDSKIIENMMKRFNMTIEAARKALSEYLTQTGAKV